MAARELTSTLLRSEEEVAVWEAWLPQAHAAQNQLTAFLGGKKGAIAVTCMPQGKEEDELPGSVTTRFDGEYLVAGELDGYPRHSLQPARLNMSVVDCCCTDSVVALISGAFGSG
jgi:hypothetical protein|eukprot:COSAG02_NODE_2408_length_8928_cov_2.710953_7_plen_115_part_00